jgi:hypothetical protein
VHNWLERAFGVEELLQTRPVARGAAALHRSAGLGGERALERVGQVAADVAGRRVVLQADQDRTVLAAQRRPRHRQDRRERDRRDALREGLLQAQFDGGRGHQLAQRDPVALARQALEGALHQLGHGVRGGAAVAGLVAAAAAAGTGLAGADDRHVSVGAGGAGPILWLRPLGLRLGALLGHRGCLPVTARLVRARA